MGDPMQGAANMMATGVGLGIMAMGAMIPLNIMKRTMESKPRKTRRKRKKSRKR